MNLDQFVNDGMAEYLRGFRPLEGWEQLHVIYHSQQPITEKRSAYETLIAEAKDDNKLVESLLNHIKQINIALDAVNTPYNPNHIYILKARSFCIKDNNISCIPYLKSQYFGTSHCQEYYSTYVKAKQELDHMQKEAKGDGLLINKTIRVYGHISECEINTQKQLRDWDISYNGEIYSFSSDSIKNDDYIFNYFHLPAVWNIGDILITSSYDDDTIFSVAPYGYNVAPYVDDEFMYNYCHYNEVVTTIHYDPLIDEIWDDHRSIWNTERYTGELPKDQQILYDISKHFKGEKPLSKDLLTRDATCHSSLTL